MRLDMERLRKIWALVERGVDGEVDAARARALSIVAPFGLDLDDIPVLLRGGDVEQARRDREARRAEAERRAKEAARKAELKAQRQADRERAEEIERRHDGNLFRPSADERALIDAAAPYLKRHSRFEHDWGKDAIDALSAALPLPTTIGEAIAEWRRWNTLCADRRFVCRARKQGVWVSLEPVQRRMQIVADMVTHELAAADFDDLLARVTFMSEVKPDDAGLRAILRDLERVRESVPVEYLDDSAPEPRRPARSPAHQPKTATERRADVEAILASEAGQGMTLRQVADLVGVSPATVLNLKRKMGAA
jgi:DNA-binding CsgD family transcriptional regulator